MTMQFVSCCNNRFGQTRNEHLVMEWASLGHGFWIKDKLAWSNLQGNEKLDIHDLIVFN